MRVCVCACVCLCVCGWPTQTHTPHLNLLRGPKLMLPRCVAEKLLRSPLSSSVSGVISRPAVPGLMDSTCVLCACFLSAVNQERSN